MKKDQEYHQEEDFRVVIWRKMGNETGNVPSSVPSNVPSRDQVSTKLNLRWSELEPLITALVEPRSSAELREVILLCYGCGSGFSIYIPSTEKIFRCCIIPYDSLSEDSSFVLQFRFVSDTNYSNVYYINTKDLSYIENKKYKKILEQKVLNELDVEWENKGGFWFFLKNIVSRI